MPANRYMTAQEAADTLGISLQTLYAYVSRGLIRSEAAATGRRSRRYYAEDIERLLQRRELRHNPEKLAETALHWGVPVLESAITLIEDSHLYYRGQDVTVLARQASFEQVASLIWTGSMEDAVLFQTEPPDASKYEIMLLHIEIDGALLSTAQAFQVFLPIAEADDLAAYDLQPAAAARAGVRILRLMASIAAGDVPDGNPLAETLSQGWCGGERAATTLLNAALILCADHELNASSFAARTTAAAGASPYGAVLAGLAALRGIKHGGYTERAAGLLHEVQNPLQARAVLSGRLQRGQAIPGFGQQLYPQGDPRAAALLDMLEDHYAGHPALGRALALVQAAEELNTRPTIDFALAALSGVLGLPPGGMLALFALGRTAGWIAHAIEEYMENRLIRPRARYTGPLPPE